ncbi:MAG TPA: lanthionine synthetase LanC family protein [Thermoanaerobaculia bacterium]|jgi:serine/threonine-protein kinase
MNITAPLVLRNDVVLVPVSQLSAEVRAKIDFDEGDYAVSRLHGRMPSTIIDPETASLLREFREPTTIVEAVIRNSRELAKDPSVWLDELLPSIGIFLRNRVLAPAGEGEEPEMRARLEPGARVGGWEVLHCVNLIEDSELHRVVTREAAGPLFGGGAAARDIPSAEQRATIHGALKIARDTLPLEGSVFANEGAVLRYLDGFELVPRLFDEGLHEERPWLVIEWREGADAGVATQGRHDRAELLAICAQIADAYAALHERGVIHADVHPRNVLIAPGPRVTLIDFGLSRIDGGTLAPMPRGGMYYFFEPEYLASLHGPRQLEATYKGEQYALAALLYLILTGKHYLEFRFDREEMMRQSREEPPLPFAQRGVAPWPEVETILRRALKKDPSQRFDSVREMANALRAAIPTLDIPAPSAQAQQLLAEELAALERDDAYPIAPHASVNYGAAGAAMGLLRIAEARGDAKLLALAEVWRSRAATYVDERSGWYAEEHDVPEAMIGAVTPYHTAAGLHAVAAMLAYARGDAYAQRHAARNFVETSQQPCASLDLTLGRSGTLLAAALLLERGSEEVRPLGDATLRELWSHLDALPSLALQPRETYLGVAHGWSGYLYATLRWHLAAKSPLPASVMTRLDELAAQRVPRGRGAYWPRTMAGGIHDMMPGWCNGTAGHVFTWTAAYDALRHPRWLALARDAAWSAWEEPLHTSDLCCGTAGRAYALLDLYQHTGEREWLVRAHELAHHAAANARTTSQRAHALWKGELGVAALLADLEAPEEARMPLFA